MGIGPVRTDLVDHCTRRRHPRDHFHRQALSRVQHQSSGKPSGIDLGILRCACRRSAVRMVVQSDRGSQREYGEIVGSCPTGKFSDVNRRGYLKLCYGSCDIFLFSCYPEVHHLQISRSILFCPTFCPRLLCQRHSFRGRESLPQSTNFPQLRFLPAAPGRCPRGRIQSPVLPVLSSLQASSLHRVPIAYQGSNRRTDRPDASSAPSVAPARSPVTAISPKKRLSGTNPVSPSYLLGEQDYGTFP